MKVFNGLTVLLTGATGGFGTILAQRLASAGANLVLSDLAEEPLKTLAENLECEVAYIAGDITDEGLSEKLVSLAITRFGALDIAINNAGIAHSFVRFHLIPSEDARRVIDVDLMGVFYAMKYQLPAMEKQYRHSKKRGSIVNIASAAALCGSPRMAVYAAAKHGVIGLTKSAAIEYATKGIRVNAICPSFARTPMVVDQFPLIFNGPSKAESALTASIPMKRLAEVEEIIEAILFAANPKNSFMTGQAIAIDGGQGAL